MQQKKEVLFSVDFQFLSVQPCWLALYQWRAEKKKLVHDVINKCATHASYAHNVKDTDRYNMVALTVVFLRFSNADFQPTRPQIDWKTIPSPAGPHGLTVFDINQPSLPTPFYPVLVSVSVFMVLSTVFHSINSPHNSLLSYCVLPVSFLPYRSLQLYISLWKSPSALI